LLVVGSQSHFASQHILSRVPANTNNKLCV
jgi:hypothetical protein